MDKLSFKTGRIVFFFMVAIFASGVMFVSCGKDDPPVITVKLDNVVQNAITITEGSTVLITLSFQAEAGIKQIDFTQDGNNVDGYPAKSGGAIPAKSTTYANSRTFGPWSKDMTITFVTKITDNENRTEEKSFKVTVIPAE